MTAGLRLAVGWGKPHSTTSPRRLELRPKSLDGRVELLLEIRRELAFGDRAGRGHGVAQLGLLLLHVLEELLLPGRYLFDRDLVHEALGAGVDDEHLVKQV